MASELIITAMLVAAPPVLVSLVVGLLISVFQTITSVQEQTLTFAPRIVAVAVVIAVVSSFVGVRRAISVDPSQAFG